MAQESQQKKLGRVRKARVHIEYEVHTGDAIEMKDLPFVVGVLADLSGKPNQALPKMRERKFVDINRDNFDDVLEGMTPRVAYQVDNTLVDDNSKLSVELNFKKMGDFSPEAIAQQVPALKKMVDARSKLKDLLTKADGKDDVADLLNLLVENTEKAAPAAAAPEAPAAPAGDSEGEPNNE